MQIAHLGLAFFIIGATFSTQFALDAASVLKVGDSYRLDNHQFQLQKVTRGFAANYEFYRADFTVFDVQKNRQIAQLSPEKRFYSSSLPISETAISSTLWRDIYISFAEVKQQNNYSFSFYHKPLIRWLWLGSLLMFLGILCGVFANRSAKANNS